MKPFDKLFKQQAKQVLIFIGQEQVQDPFEKNKSLTYYNPLPIDAIVTDLSPTKAYWKLYGIEVKRAKELLIENHHLNLIKMSRKIQIDGQIYYGWKDNAGENINYMREGDNYIRLVVFSK